MVAVPVILGIFTYLSLVTTFSLGIAMHKFHKPVLKAHKFFAFTTIILATIYMVAVLFKYYF
ncbi:hypothetical protein HY212_06440 [Candidatus Pacearchaeota archaeon]|nr:hypothetical protein [Candidatus Pacearchaeota archaeon]